MLCNNACLVSWRLEISLGSKARGTFIHFTFGELELELELNETSTSKVVLQSKYDKRMETCALPENERAHISLLYPHEFTEKEATIPMLKRDRSIQC